MKKAALALALMTVPALAAPPPAPRPPAPAIPPVPLAMLPSIARVKVTHHGGRAFSIVHDINLPRGDWKGEALRFHVAFGAPGPRAIDAHLVPVADGAVEADEDEVGEVLATERVPRRPVNAHPLLGRETMAGIVVSIKTEQMLKALAKGSMASLRIRALVEATEPDTAGASSLVVRLGASRGTPLTLGRIALATAPSLPPLTKASASLCGPEADTHPLAVKPHDPSEPAPIAPVLAVRHATDDLCLRVWTALPPTPIAQ